MDFIKKELKRLQTQGLYRSLHRRSSPQNPEIVIDGQKVLNFCSNDYLGLANDPRLLKGAMEAIRSFGAGSGAARLISGNFDLADRLEVELARWKGTQKALLFNSGYHANIGVISALVGEGDVILSDELNHASLIDGCRLSKAKTLVYRHNDMHHLEKILKKVRGRKLIVTEAVFSMEGDLCPLDDILSLSKKYNAMVYLDEAHAIGVLGKDGIGLAPKNPPENLIAMGTLGKAFGSYGAFVAGTSEVREYLVNKARSFIFSTALPPAAIGAALAALKIIRNDSKRREQLWNNIHRVKTDHPSPIISIPIGDPKKTMKLSQKLFKEGIYLQGIRPPTVPEGTSRLRLTLTAAHEKKRIDRLIEALAWIQKS